MRSSSDQVRADFARRLTGLTVLRTAATTVLLIFLSRNELVALSTPDAAAYALIGAVYVVTLATGIVLRLGIVGSWLGWGHVAFDVVLAGAVVFLSGGLESPFTFAYLLAVVGAGALLAQVGALASAIAVAITTVVVMVATTKSAVGTTQVASVSVQVLAEFLVAGLVGSLAEQTAKAGGRLSARERDLAQLTALQNRIVQVMPSGLVTCDASGDVTYMNPAARTILGLSATDEIQHVAALFQGVLKLKVVRRSELQVTTPHGVRSLGLSVTPLEDDRSASLIVFQDLTQLRAVEAELERIDHLATLGRFSAQLAHEIRNPLASMRGSAQMLAGDVTDSSNLRLAQIILREADRLSGLVDNYLKLARPPPPTKVPTRLDQLVSETVEMLRADPLVAARQIDEDVGPVTSEVDPGQMKQVIVNLLRNAVAAIGPTGSVRVSVALDADAAHLRVWDSAGSIAPSDLVHIFEPFFSKRDGGTGLGLSTVAAIVHAHGGTIEVSSTPADGTQFSVRLPNPARRSEVPE